MTRPGLVQSQSYDEAVKCKLRSVLRESAKRVVQKLQEAEKSTLDQEKESEEYDGKQGMNKWVQVR